MSKIRLNKKALINKINGLNKLYAKNEALKMYEACKSNMELIHKYENELVLVSSKLSKLNDQFENVSFKIESIEDRISNCIDLNKSTLGHENTLYRLELKQYEIQLKIESLGGI